MQKAFAKEHAKEKKREVKGNDKLSRDQLVSNFTNDLNKYDKQQFDIIATPTNIKKMQKLIDRDPNVDLYNEMSAETTKPQTPVRSKSNELTTLNNQNLFTFENTGHKQNEIDKENEQELDNISNKS